MVGSISISGVSKHFVNPTGERITALDNVSLDIPAGSFVALIGPSGCGKSTLLRLISGLIPMDDGSLTLDGTPIKAPGADRGFMFQEHTLFPWLSIYDNIAFGLRARGIYKQEKDRVDEFIEMVGLKGFEHSYPHQLSGGMCQRASLARALVGKPKVLLLDEPLGALDAFTRMNMQDEILRIWKETGMTAIMVTHDVDEAVYLSDKVVVMTPRPGRITGTLDIKLARPRARIFFTTVQRSFVSSITAAQSKSPTTTFKIVLKNVCSLLLLLLYIFLERTENHEKERHFISSGKRTSRSCTDTLAYRLRRLKQQFGRFRGSRFRRFRRNPPASDLLSFSLCRTDVHRDRERLL